MAIVINYNYGNPILAAYQRLSRRLCLIVFAILALLLVSVLVLPGTCFAFRWNNCGGMQVLRLHRTALLSRLPSNCFLNVNIPTTEVSKAMLLLSSITSVVGIGNSLAQLLLRLPLVWCHAARRHSLYARKTLHVVESMVLIGLRPFLKLICKH